MWKKEAAGGSTNLSVTSNFDWLVFVPRIGQVSRFGERKLPPGGKQKKK